jgi:thioesterase domain-containing protein
LLGVRSARPDDNFFESGGNSFLALRLFDEIARQFATRLPLSLLFRGLTPERLAQAIADQAPKPASSPYVVPIRQTGTKPPLFLLHGIGGEVISYGPLAARLEDDQPVYGLVPAPLDVEGGDLSIERLAGAYVAAVKTVSPRGPYFLGGYCGGAAIAYEMAQQLHRANEPVGLLAIIDHHMSPTAIEDRSSWSAIVDGARNAPWWIREDLVPSGLAEITGRIRSRTRALLASASQHLPGRGGSSRRDIRDELGMWIFPDYMVGVLEKLHDAFRRYVPRPYPGRVTVFKPRTKPLVCHRLRHDLGWSDLAIGGVEIVTVPGSHGTILKEPLVAHLAGALSTALDHAITSADPRPGVPSTAPTTSRSILTHASQPRTAV